MALKPPRARPRADAAAPAFGRAIHAQGGLAVAAILERRTRAHLECTWTVGKIPRYFAVAGGGAG
jgi:hypothetical protein